MMNDQCSNDAQIKLKTILSDWKAAEMQGDTAKLTHLLSDDFTGIGPLGFILTKQQWINRLKSGELKYETLDLDEVSIRIHGDAAIVTARQKQQAKYNNQAVPDSQLRSTFIFTQSPEDWKLAGIHLSQISAPHRQKNDAHQMNASTNNTWQNRVLEKQQNHTNTGLKS